MSSGFFDLQMNGFAGVDYQQADLSKSQLADSVAALRRHGTDRILLTLITDHIDSLAEKLRRIEAFRAAGLDNRRFGWRAVRNKRYAYVVNRGYFPGETVQKLLYDLEKDPYQLSPLLLKEACEHPIALQLENELAKYLKQSEDTFALTD